MYAKKNSGKKVVLALLAIVLLISGAVGGTVAWLKDSTDTVTNTFTVGDINIDLTENGTSAKDSPVTNNNFKIIPGGEQEKDPTVTVKANSEACWLFVKITESNNYNGSTPYVTWSVDRAWTELSQTTEDGVKTYVYYIDQAATTADVPHAVLNGSKVTYADTLTKADLNALDGEKPSLEFAAYAVQKANGNSIFTVEQAWDIAQDGTLTPPANP